MFIVELTLLYTTINLTSDYRLLEFMYNLAVLPRFLISLNFVYIAFSIKYNFKFNKKLLMFCALGLFLYICVCIIKPQNHIENNLIMCSFSGRFTFFVEIILELLSLVILYRNRRKFIHLKKQFLVLFLCAISFVLMEIITFYYTVILNMGLPIVFNTSAGLMIKLILSPLIFIFINIEILKILNRKRVLDNSELLNLGLTNREIEVTYKILQGYNNLQIQNDLAIAKSTLKTHINKIFLKLNVTSRLELIYLFIDKPNIFYQHNET